MGRQGVAIGYQSPDLTSGRVKYLGLAGSVALSLEGYDVYIDAPEPGEFEGTGVAPGFVGRAQLTFGPVELGLNVEVAYLWKAEETAKIWGLTLGLALF